MNNPFAATNGFRRDSTALLAVMLQLQPSNLGVCSRNPKTTCCKERKKGLCGNALACCGMIETQNRGALHIHMLTWTAVLPLLLQKVSHIKETCTAISDLLNTQFKCFLEPHEHLEDMTLKHLQTKNHTASNDKNINPPATGYPTSCENSCKLRTHVIEKNSIH